MNKSLVKLREFRRKHNLCRECGIIKEVGRENNPQCALCQARRNELANGAPHKRHTVSGIAPLPECGSRATRMMELSALLSKRAQSAHREQARGAA